MQAAFVARHRSPPSEIRTERLVLRASHPDLAADVAAFHARNARHFAPWEPPRPAGYLTLEATSARLAQERVAFGGGLAWRYWLCLGAQADVIGQCQVSQVQRGPFQSASLGYGLDAQVLGQGLMTEALKAVVAQVFATGVRLHRLQAAVQPENVASQRVLRRLGFVHEGRSARYLYIDGAWRDHELFALVNADWRNDESPVDAG